MSSFATRLNQFIGYLRLSKRAFEEECSIAQGNVSHCIKNNTTLSSKNLVKISKRYNELNTNWLINGSGNMIIENIQKSSFHAKKEHSTNKDWKDKKIEELEGEINMWKEFIHLPQMNVESIVKAHPDFFGKIEKELSELEYIHIISGTVSKGSDAQKTSFYINSSYSALCKLIGLGFVDSATAFGEILLKKAAWNHSYHICADIAKYLVRHYYRFEDLETAEMYDDLVYKYNEMNMIEYEAQKLYCKVIYNHKHGLSVDKNEIQASLDYLRSKMQLDNCTYHYYYYQCQCILSKGAEYLKNCEDALQYFTNLYFNHEAYIAIFLNKIIYYQIENNNLESAEANLNKLFSILKHGSSKWFIASYSQINLLLKKGDTINAAKNIEKIVNHPSFSERSNDEKIEWKILSEQIEQEKNNKEIHNSK